MFALRASTAPLSRTYPPLVSDTPPLLEIRDLSKTFGSVQALTDVDFGVRSVRSWRSSATTAPANRRSSSASPVSTDTTRSRSSSTGAVHINRTEGRRRVGIEVVYQDLALCDDLDVVQNMYLGREIRDFPPPAQGAGDGATCGGDAQGPSRHHDQVHPSGGRDPLGRAAAVGRRRARGHVELEARRSSTSPPPRSGSRRPSRSWSSCDGWPSKGSRSCSISHNLHDIFETATRITVLRLGRNVGVYRAVGDDPQEVVHAITAGIPTKVSGIAETSTEVVA